MKKQLSIALLALSLMLPIAGIRAQDTVTEVPPTQEIVETAVPTIEATLAPTETPVPVPPAPSPIETLFSQVNWTIVILAGVLAFFGFLALVVRTLGISAPVALWEGGKATVRAIYGDIDRLVNATPDPIDNTLWDSAHSKIEELFTEVDRLRKELAATKAQVSQNSADIVTTNQVVKSQQAGG